MDYLIFFIGSMIGSISSCLIFNMMYVGYLRVDHSDPYDGPYMFLELQKNIDTIERKKYVILRVKQDNLVTRK